LISSWQIPSDGQLGRSVMTVTAMPHDLAEIAFVHRSNAFWAFHSLTRDALASG
jgi:hypothetical protein